MAVDLAALAAAPAWVWLAALPLLLATCTAFTKVSVVLAALRIGLGAEALLPWSAVLALALVVSAVIMAPLAAETAEGVIAAARPLLEFLARHAAPAEVDFFAGLQGLAGDHPLVVVPAFLVSELGEALHLAVLILLPFALLDLVVAQIFALVGLPGQPLALVTLPLKVRLFLAVGGWAVVIGGLVEGYARRPLAGGSPGSSAGGAGLGGGAGDRLARRSDRPPRSGGLDDRPRGRGGPGVDGAR